MEKIKTLDVKEALDGQKGMSGFAWAMFILSALLMAIDGYDVTSLSLAVTSIAAEWGIDKGDFGYIMSLANVGLIAGSFVFGWIGDKFGRKVSIISSLVLFGVFTYITTLCTELVSMTIVRMLVSLGVGGLTPCITAINNDFAPEKAKMKRVSTLFVGMNFGSAVTGFVAAAAMTWWDWRGIFYMGAILPLVALIPTCLWMPESIGWLVVNQKPGDNKRARMAKILGKFRPDLKNQIDENTEFVYSVKSETEKHGVGELFKGRMKWITPLLWLCFVLCLFVAYFFKSWMPTILTVKGMEAATASWVTSMMMFGSMVGSATIGFILDKIGLSKASIWPVLLFFVACLFGALPPEVLPTIIVIMLLGYCQSSCYAINPAMTPLFYPINLRSTASGFNLGIGRIGSIVAPIVGGWMLATQMPVATMFPIVVAPEFIIAIGFFVMMSTYTKYFKGRDIVDAQTLSLEELQAKEAAGAYAEHKESSQEEGK